MKKILFVLFVICTVISAYNFRMIYVLNKFKKVDRRLDLTRKKLMNVRIVLESNIYEFIEAKTLLDLVEKESLRIIQNGRWYFVTKASSDLDDLQTLLKYSEIVINDANNKGYLYRHSWID